MPSRGERPAGGPPQRRLSAALQGARCGAAAPADSASPLAAYRRLIRSPGDRVRWACVLEAVAPKLGNVHPAASFVDLQLGDFVVAGEQLAAAIEESSDGRVGQTILKAVKRCRERTGTNVNLGIALLIVPLVHAESVANQQSCELPAAMRQVLDRLDGADGQDVFAAIRWANPGGLGRTEQMDVHEDAPVDLVAAMRAAADRDAIALQYATGFADLWGEVVPLLEAAIGETGDLLLGIRRAQLQLLARAPDSLIARKCGAATAAEARARAAAVLAVTDEEKRAVAETELDAWLRGDNHRRNPGTTADLIAAGLYVLLGRG